MFFKVILFFIGIILIIIGMINIILYSNLLSIGYTFLEYVNFIIRRVEFIYLIIGIVIIFLLVFKRRK